MPLEIRTFASRLMETNSYVFSSDGQWAVVDAGIAPVDLLAFLQAEGIVPEAVILTHGHCDHIAGVNDLRDRLGPVPVWCPAGDAGMLPDPARNLSALFGMPVSLPAPERLFAPGDVLEIGSTRWNVLDTSGHTPGGVSLYCPDEAVVFTGDALFCQGIGRTDFPGGEPARLLGNIRRELLTLPPATAVYPGHGPATTIGAEAKHNPFLAGGGNG